MRFLLLKLLLIGFFINNCFSSEPININSATAQEIESSLPGIGRVKAQAIVNHRSANGLYTDVKQLLDVKGIGPRTLERITPLIRLRSSVADAHVTRQLQNLEQYDQAVRQAIKRIVSLAENAAQLDRREELK